MQKKFPFILPNCFLLTNVNEKTGDQQIILQKTNQKGRVEFEHFLDCIHTNIIDGSIINLDIEDKFFALNSWAEAIISQGTNLFFLRNTNYQEIISPFLHFFLKFFIRVNSNFSSFYLDHLKKVCIFNSETHQPSLISNLTFLLDCLIFEEFHNLENEEDLILVQKRKNKGNKYTPSIFAHKDIDTILEKIALLNPSAQLFFDSDKFSAFIYHKSVRRLDDWDIFYHYRITKYENKEFLIKNTSFLDLSYENIQFLKKISYRYPEKIETLNMSGNKICNLEGIERFSNLIELDVSNNNIRVFPSEQLKQLNQIKTLKLQNNQIKRISGLPSYFNIETLLLGMNQIENLNEISCMTNLKILDIANNTKIKSYLWLKELTNLEFLNLQGCNMDDFHLPFLPNLKKLSIRRTNKTTTINEINLNNIPNIKILLLDDNDHFFSN